MEIKTALTKILSSTTDRETAAPNSTFAIGGVLCSADSLVVAKSLVLRINIIGKNPAHRKSAKRYGKCFLNSRTSKEISTKNKPILTQMEFNS